MDQNFAFGVGSDLAADFVFDPDSCLLMIISYCTHMQLNQSNTSVFILTVSDLILGFGPGLAADVAF